MKPRSRWLTPGVTGIGLASFLSDAGHEIVTSVLPNLLTVTLGAPAAALGLIEGISDGLAGGARLLGGALADDPKRRRRLVVGGYSATAVLSGLIAFAAAVWQVGILRAGAWTARGLRVPARNALLADIAPGAAYGRAFGFERAMDNLGAIVGPAVTLALVATFGVRTMIGLSVIPGLLAAAAIVYAVRQAPRDARRDRHPLRLQFRPATKGPLGRLMIGIGAFEVGNIAATLLILRATEVLEGAHGRQGATQIALTLYVVYNLSAALVSIPAGRLGDRLGTPFILAAGVTSFAVAYLGFAAGGGIAALGSFFVAAGIGIGCVETSEHAAVAAMAPQEARASVFGVLAGVQSVGNLAASGVAGLLWSAFSPRVAFLYLTAWMTASLVAIISQWALLGRTS
ncbi:MAG TPA: MFS transporter [Actinomycetota bacterium]|nr:MFS transporter [Actinomycetota bacterium]